MSGAERFRAGVESGDVEAALAALSDDVVLHSPVTFRPFDGKVEDVTVLIRPLSAVDALAQEMGRRLGARPAG